MKWRNDLGAVVADSWDSEATLLNPEALPFWLRRPRMPVLLRPPSFRVTGKDPATLDLFDGPPPAPRD